MNYSHPPSRACFLALRSFSCCLSSLMASCALRYISISRFTCMASVIGNDGSIVMSVPPQHLTYITH